VSELNEKIGNATDSIIEINGRGKELLCVSAAAYLAVKFAM